MNISVHEALKKILVDNTKALELYNSGQANVAVKIGPYGSIKEVTLTPKNLVSSSDNSSTDMETLSTSESDEEEMETSSSDDDFEEIEKWLKNESSSEDDLDLTLEWDDDIDAECNEAIDIPDVFEATQLPPGRMTGVLSNAEPVCRVEVKNEEVEPDTIPLIEKKTRKKSDRSKKEHEPDTECWNCKAPKPIHGIYRENADNMRLVFCCDKPTRVKPSNNVIECNLKNYPHYSWW